MVDRQRLRLSPKVSIVFCFGGASPSREISSPIHFSYSLHTSDQFIANLLSLLLRHTDFIGFFALSVGFVAATHGVDALPGVDARRDRTRTGRQ
jgi:hypothetical protein